MILNQLQNELTKDGYRQLMVNVPGIYLYCTVWEREYYAVLIVDHERRRDLTQWQYANLCRQVRSNFEKQGHSVHVLGIICTDEPDQMAGFEYEDTWVVDLAHLRLILYENQTGRFLNVRPMIERILDEAAGRIEKPRESLISRVKKCRYFSPVNTLMIAINVIVFFLTVRYTYSNRYLVEHGALYWPYVIGEGEYYRLFTYMFLHSGYSHIVNNMLVLLFIGDNLERAAGKLRYLIIYLGSGVMAGVVSMLWNIYQQEQVVCVGASGAIFGVVGAVAFIVIINKGRLEDISGRQIILFVILSLYGGLTSQGVDNAAHIGGLVTGAILAAVLYRRKKKAPARIEQAAAENRD